jgi:hypothetical protein
MGYAFFVEISFPLYIYPPIPMKAMTLKRVFFLLLFSSSLSVFAHANNVDGMRPEQVNGDSLKLKPSASFQGLIFFSFPKAETAMRKEDSLKD